jgi:hypothetical protein
LVERVARAICKALPDAWVDTFRPSGPVPDGCLLPFDEEPCDGRVLAQAAIDACHAEEMRNSLGEVAMLLRCSLKDFADEPWAVRVNALLTKLDEQS